MAVSAAIKKKEQYVIANFRRKTEREQTMGDQDTNATAAEQQEKTFTQEQVNSIVGKRLAEQKAALEADFVKREQELNRREMTIRANELLVEKGLPKELSEVMRYETEEELVKAIGAIEHVRGFKFGEQERDDGVPKGFHVLENRLPKGGDYHSPNPIAKAFKLDASESILDELEGE